MSVVPSRGRFSRLVPLLLLAMLVGVASATHARAQDDDGAAQNDAPRTGLEPGTTIPSVDGIDAQRLLDEAPEQRLIELTLGLYEAAAAYEGPCDKMWRPVRSFLDAHESEIEAAAARIAERAATMTPDELSALAESFAAGLIGHPSVRAGQDALYECLRSAEVQGKGRPLEKEMRRFFRLQKPMIDAIIGPVD